MTLLGITLEKKDQDEFLSFFPLHWILWGAGCVKILCPLLLRAIYTLMKVDSNVSNGVNFRELCSLVCLFCCVKAKPVHEVSSRPFLFALLCRLRGHLRRICTGTNFLAFLIKMPSYFRLTDRHDNVRYFATLVLRSPILAIVPHFPFCDGGS